MSVEKRYSRFNPDASGGESGNASDFQDTGVTIQWYPDPNVTYPCLILQQLDPRSNEDGVQTREGRTPLPTAAVELEFWENGTRMVARIPGRQALALKKLPEGSVIRCRGDYKGASTRGGRRAGEFWNLRFYTPMKATPEMEEYYKELKQFSQKYPATPMQPNPNARQPFSEQSQTDNRNEQTHGERSEVTDESSFR